MKLIVMGRDGVINHPSEQFIKSPEEWRAIEGSAEAIAQLKQWGWRVVVATNQSLIGRGLIGLETVNEINDKMVRALNRVGGRLDAVFFCPHVDDDRCECRKPKPGMLREIGERFHVDLTTVPVVGHTRADMDAALAVGARPFLVRTGYGAATFASYEEEGGVPEGVQVCADLAEVVSVLTD